MKKIFLLSFFILAVITVKSQSYIKTNIYGLEYSRTKHDSALHIPSLRDTLPHGDIDTTPQIRLVNGQFYYHFGKWRQVQGSGGGTLDSSKFVLKSDLANSNDLGNDIEFRSQDPVTNDLALFELNGTSRNIVFITTFGPSNIHNTLTFDSTGFQYLDNIYAPHTSAPGWLTSKHYVDSSNFFYYGFDNDPINQLNAAINIKNNLPTYLLSTNKALTFNADLQLDSTDASIGIVTSNGNAAVSNRISSSIPNVILSSSKSGKHTTINITPTGRAQYDTHVTTSSTTWLTDKEYVDSIAGGTVISANATAQNMGFFSSYFTNLTLTGYAYNVTGTASFEWDNPLGAPISFLPTAVAITPGVYTLIVSDDSGKQAFYKIQLYPLGTIIENKESSFFNGSPITLQAGTYIPDSILTLRINGSGTYLVEYSYDIIANGATFATPGYFESGVYQTDATSTLYGLAYYEGSLPVMTTLTTPTGSALITVSKQLFVPVTTTLRITVYSKLVATPTAGNVQATSRKITAIKLY